MQEDTDSSLGLLAGPLASDVNPDQEHVDALSSAPLPARKHAAHISMTTLLAYV